MSVRDEVRVRAGVLLVILPGHDGAAALDALHGDAAVDRADERAQVAADAAVGEDLDAGAARLGARGNRLMRAVIARGIAEPAAGAFVLIDLGNELVIEVELLPV